jgi:hypothetical protein
LFFAAKRTTAGGLLRVLSFFQHEQTTNFFPLSCSLFSETCACGENHRFFFFDLAMSRVPWAMGFLASGLGENPQELGEFPLQKGTFHKRYKPKGITGELSGL